MLSYKIFDNYGQNLIFASYSLAAFKAKVSSLNAQGIDVNSIDGPVRTNVKLYLYT